MLALCPGPMNTGIASGAPIWVRPLVWLLFTLFFKDPNKAAKYVINLATQDSFKKKTGIYCFRSDEVEPSLDAQNEEAAKLLWEQTEDLIRQKGGQL